MLFSIVDLGGLVGLDLLVGELLLFPVDPVFDVGVLFGFTTCVLFELVIAVSRVMFSLRVMLEEIVIVSDESGALDWN